MLAGVFMVTSCSKKQQPPNIVFILVDDLGWADVKCNNPGSFYDTPNIDMLAEKGVRFTRAYSANPVCSPSRAAILTGKHPNRLNITDWIPGNDPKKRKLLGPQDADHLALGEVTIGERLKEQGYKTGFVGKWHLGGDGFMPEDQGFDVNIGGNDKGSPPGGYYSPYNNPNLKDGPEGEYLTDRLTEEAIHFIKENQNNPFLLYLAYYTVHMPIQAAKKHIAVYQEKKKTLITDTLNYQREGDGWTKLHQDNADYASMVAAMDENVGHLLDTLKYLGIDDNTWVIFTSDNGGLSTLYNKNAPTANEPLRAGKGWCYEGGIRVPLVISGPEVATPGKVVDQPVTGMDFFNTILDVVGQQYVRGDGESLLPLLNETGMLSRQELFWHYPHYHGSAWTPGSALISGDWKIIYFYEDEKVELYNLKDDPMETTNVAARFPDKIVELKKKLEKHLEDTGAKYPVVNPDYVPRD